MRIKDIFSGTTRTYIIAELSANHKGSLALALKTIKAMKAVGADAVKVQTYTPDTITLNCENRYFRLKGGTLWDGRTLYDLYKEAMTPWEWHTRLRNCARDCGLEFFSSPFDSTAADFLEKLGVPAYKIASFEITDIPLIKHVALKDKPVIISTGIAEQSEIEEALIACRQAGNNKVALLKCTSAYPAPLSEMNIRTIPDMARRFKRPVGLSDHSLGITAAVASISLGAKIIEKHFILSRKLGGPDAAFSLEPAEFRDMVKAVRETEVVLGRISYSLSAKSRKSRELSRSIFCAKDMRKDDVFTEENIRSVRPYFGLPPKYLPGIIGKKVTRDIKAGTPLTWRHITK